MLKKLFLALTITAVSLFAMNFQTASKEELMSIKGIGEKRAADIIKYRKTHKLKSAADLKGIPGIGDEIADNAKKGIKNADPKKAVKKAKTTKKKVTSKAKSTKEKTASQVKKKSKDKTKAAKEKAKKSVKKKAGDTTKRAKKKTKVKAKKAVKK